MNQGLIQTSKESLGVVDSLPVPLCQPIRNFRAKKAGEIADIDYNATKNICFYGLKFQAILNTSGLVLNFVVSSARVYEDCLKHFHIPLLFGDTSYIGEDLASVVPIME